MFGIGWSEIFLIGIVALLVVGPKDLPVVLRTLGQYVRRVRDFTAELRGQVEALSREAELDDLKKRFAALTPEDLDRLVDDHNQAILAKEKEANVGAEEKP
jgi:sec-independent protein translocase protein TatB